jgi:hypothetical protein
MSADLFLCLTSPLVIVELFVFLLIISENLPSDFVLLVVGYNDSILGFAHFFEEYPLTMIGVHKWGSALYEVRAGNEEAVFIVETNWVLCEINGTRWTI